jgi:hypothetical protein
MREDKDATRREDAMQRLEAAVAAGNAWGAVEIVMTSPILDGLVRVLRAKWPALPHADVDEATSQAVDDLHATIRKRTPITNPVAWLYKVADRKAWRLNMRHGRDQLRDPVDLDAMGSATEQDGESPATTEEVVAIARTLLRQFPQGGHR